MSVEASDAVGMNPVVTTAKMAEVRMIFSFSARRI
jgi:hypothetical protein